MLKEIDQRANSLDKIEMLSGSGTWIVRKTFLEGNKRAQDAVKKQLEFSHHTSPHPNILAIPITKQYTENKSLVIEMPFIDGINGEEFAVYANLEQLNLLKCNLDFIIAYQLKNSNQTPLNTISIRAKLDQIIEKVEDTTLNKLSIKAAERIIKNLTAEKIPTGYCHGDLTLSNIILTKNQKLYLFDFLPTHLESPLQDIAKLFQDLILCWSARHSSQHVQTKAKIMGIHTMPKSAITAATTYCKPTYILCLLTLLRIVPYANDPATTKWLTTNLNLENFDRNFENLT